MLKKNDIDIEMTSEAMKHIAETSYDVRYGARPVKRAIQHLLLDDLSKELLAGRLDRSRPIKVDAKDGSLVMQ